MPTVNYSEYLYQELQDDEFAVGYVRELLSNYESPVEVLLGLKNIVEARGGFTQVSKEAGISRTHLHRIINGENFPRLDTFLAILEAVEIRLFDEEREAA